MEGQGLGQILKMGILGQFFGGGQQNQQQQQQQQPNGQNQGMNQAQWANLAIALNSMRLEPDENLATAMREKIASSTEADEIYFFPDSSALFSQTFIFYHPSIFTIGLRYCSNPPKTQNMKVW